jgi:hypothetical protein
MSGNIGTITYGNLTLLPGYDTTSSGLGNLNVAGNTLLSGSSTTVLGTLAVSGTTTLSSNLAVNGIAQFNSTVSFTQPMTNTSTLIISNTTNATSTVTGSVQVAGGIGIVQDTWMGGLLNLAGAATLQSTLNVSGTSTFSGVVNITNTTPTTSYTNGALVVSGGLGVALDIRTHSGNIFLAGNLILNNDLSTGKTYLASPINTMYINQNGLYDVILNQASSANFNVAGATNTSIASGLQVFVTTDTTSASTGSVVVSGGVGIAKALYVGSNLTVTGSSTFNGAVTYSSTTESTSTSTGSLVLAGGLGVAKNTYIGGILDIASVSSNTSFIGSVGIQSSNSSINYVQSGNVTRTGGSWQTLKFSPVGSTTSIMSINSTNVTVDTTTASTSTSTGSLVVSGGVGVNGAAFFGSTLNVAGSTKLSGNVWLSGNSLYLNSFSSSTDGLVYSATASNGGPLLFGNLGGALGTTSGTSLTALTWDTTQSVQILGTNDTSSISTGTLVVSGGGAFKKSLTVGANIYLGSTSITSGNSGLNVVINANTNGSVQLFSNSGSNNALVQSTWTAFEVHTNGVSFAQILTLQVDKGTGHLNVNGNGDDADLITTSVGNMSSAITCTGGVSIAKNLWVGANQLIAGNLTVAGNISTTGGNPVTFSSTVNSTSTSTGAVVISGGLGVAKNVFVGGSLNVVNTTQSTSYTTGAFILSGGLGIASDLYSNGNATFAQTLTVNGSSTLVGAVVVSNTTVSSSTSTGALTVAGGVGILGALNVGGITSITNNTQSSSISTGCLVLSGGLGLAGNLYGSGVVNFTNTTQSTSTSTGALIVSGGAGIASNLFVGGNTNINGSLTVSGNISSTAGTITFSSTTDSTNPASGALVISGGVGIAKALYVGSTINSTSSSTGGVVVSGGLGVALDTFMGGNLALTGTNPLLTFAVTGQQAPTFITRSAGTLVLLKPMVSATMVDYAIGKNTNVFWSSIPQNNSTYSYQWYGGIVSCMSLNGQGDLAVSGTTDATSSTSGSFQLLGGMGVGGSLYLGSALNVNTTAYFNGGITANSTYTGAGVVTINNVSNSTSTSTGAIVTTGGVGIAQNVYIGGNVNTAGNNVTTGNLTVSGTTNLNATTVSTSTGSGALVVVGGVGIGGSLNVGGTLSVAGNTTISGNLMITGTQTVVNTESLSTSEAVVLVNSSPSGTADAGLAMKRYQAANDSGLGDIAADATPEFTCTCPSNGTTSTIVLTNAASSVTDFYNGYWLYIYSGTGTGQVRRVKSYDGPSRTITIWQTADQSPSIVPVEGLDFSNPADTTSIVKLFGDQYIITVWDEVADEYFIGGMALNPTTNQVAGKFVSEVTVHCGAVKVHRDIKCDTINERNTNNGVTVESVLIKDGNISNVGTVNGSVSDLTSTVQLIDNDLGQSIIIPGTHPYGAYTILVSAVVNSGTSACFFITGSTSRNGSVFRATSTLGANGENLTISWAQGNQPVLRFLTLPTGGSGNMLSYVVRVSAVV